MGKLIVGTFLILGLVFYELSGGAEFSPESRPDQVAEAEIIQEVATPDVTRVNVATLTNVAPEPQVQEAEIIQASVDIQSVADVAPEPAVEPEVAEVVVEEPAPLDLRVVAGSRVNMRSGPGTSFDVLDTLDGGTETEVIEVNANGWARVRITDTGQIGWMAERLLTNG